jgi:epoxide hydrolase-like predicted phosphatase
MKNNLPTQHAYTNIIFDLFDVLVVHSPIPQNILGKDVALEPKFMIFFKTEAYANYKKGLVDLQQFIELLPKELPAPLFKTVLEQIPSHVQPIPGMIDLLELLKSRGYRLYLLTNVAPHTMPVLEQRFSFLQLFDGILTSFEAHTLKPDPKIFQLLLERFELKASDCFFIDDLEKNIAAAQKLGIDGTVFTVYETLHNELKNRTLL